MPVKVTEEGPEDRVYFPVPVLESKASMKPKPEPVNLRSIGRRAVETNKQRADLIRERLMECRIEGFDIGAVVVQRYKSRNPALVPNNWGIVTSLTRWCENMENYKPLHVSWVLAQKPDSSHDMEDLYLIHAAKPDQELIELLDIQDDPKDMSC